MFSLFRSVGTSPNFHDFSNMMDSDLVTCPGFDQDRVNFHQKSGGNTAWRADPTWPNRTKYSIPCAIMLDSGWGGAGWQEINCGSRACTGQWVVRVALCILQFVLCFPLICIIVVTVPSVFCSVKLPLSQPTSFSLFLSFLHSTPVRGGEVERPRGPIAVHSQTTT